MKNNLHYYYYYITPYSDFSNTIWLNSTCNFSMCHRPFWLSLRGRESFVGQEPYGWELLFLWNFITFLCCDHVTPLPVPVPLPQPWLCYPRPHPHPQTFTNVLPTAWLCGPGAKDEGRKIEDWPPHTCWHVENGNGTEVRLRSQKSKCQCVSL